MSVSCQRWCKTRNGPAILDSDAGALAAAVYESQSGGIFDTLQGLQDKAADQLSGSLKKEIGAAHNFDMLKQPLDGSIGFATKDMAKVRAGLAKSGEKKAAAEGDLDVKAEDLKANIEQLAELHHDCMTNAEDLKAEAKSRGVELKALVEAQRVLIEAIGGVG